ncbi:MAG: flavodoxin [Firmicutes bacterium]|nr:flavodoxin [Bacillota bacterium]
MNIAIRYYTKTGNTKKICEAMGEAIGVEAKSIDVPLDEKVDVLFLGNSVYAANIDPKVKHFIGANVDKIGCLVNVSSAALLNSTYSSMCGLCKALNIPISGSEFHTKGEFKFMHKGRPNAEDLKAAADFAKSLVGEPNKE